MLILALRHAVVTELVAVSNLRHCKDNDKSKAGLRGTPLSTFVTENFTLLSKKVFVSFKTKNAEMLRCT